MVDEKHVYGTPAEKANRRGHLGPDTRSFIREGGEKGYSPQDALSGDSLPKRRYNEVGRGV